MVDLIFRSKKRNEHSIEVIFEGIAESLQKAGYDINCCYLPSERYNSIKALLTNIFFVKRLSGDVFHITGEAYFLANVLPRNRTILTIHDLVMLEPDHSKGIKYLLYKYFWFYFPVKRAAVVTCISKKTKEELVHLFPQFEEKIKIISNPYGRYLKPMPYVFHDDCPTILIIGTRKNKNIENIICATCGINCRLSIIGKLSKEQITLLSKKSIEYSNNENLSNDEIMEQYCKCDLVCFPSLYEGFGLPIIEAQAIGRPVITSDLSPMNEVAGKGALLVNPNDVDMIRNAINRIINEKTLREKLVQEGFDNVKQYSMDSIVLHYKDLYDAIR